MCPNSIPVFLPKAGIGISKGEYVPQLRGFDVYYNSPIIVGFHVIGYEDPSDTELDLYAFSEEDISAGVIGFYCYEVSDKSSEIGFDSIIEDTLEDEDNGPSVLGFYAVEVETPSIDLDLVMSDQAMENDAQVSGFTVIDVT